MARVLSENALLEQSIHKKYRAEIWAPFLTAIRQYDLIQEGLTSKLLRTPEEVRAKFRGSLTRIVNEGAAGLICLIL